MASAGAKRQSFARPSRPDTGRQIELIVRELSFSGCRIEKPDYAQLPDRFTLSYVGLDKPDAEVAVLWRQGLEVGVQFLTRSDEFATPKRAPAAAPQKLSIGALRKLSGRAD